MALDAEQINIIKATVPVLAEHGQTITTVFYKNLLTENPELNKVFNQANQRNGHQASALATAVYAYAANIDNLAVLSAAVERICSKHASLYIRPEHYSIVGKYLLLAMKEVLGDALTQDIHDAWAAAYWQLANLMIARESQLLKATGDWNDWRDFRIARKVPEAAEITSFYLEPVDGKPLPAYKPGQYISIETNVPALEYPQSRQYSLSDAPSTKYYRISVKREGGLDPTNPADVAHPGYISTVLHEERKAGDILQVSHPEGDFFLDTKINAEAPIVLLAGGVGLTPLLSMLNTLVAEGTTRPISWIQAARSPRHHAFASHVRQVQKEHPNVRAIFYHRTPGRETGEHSDVRPGRLELSRLERNEDLHVDKRDTQYFVCGPEKFMADMEAGLMKLGVEQSRIHLELFGTGGIQRAL